MSFSDERFADHREAWELIPWVVNGTATDEERTLVHAHLAGCPDCAGEFRVQSELQASVQGAATPEADAAASFLKLSARLDSATAATHSRRFAAFTGRRALLAVIALEAVCLIVLSTAPWMRGPTLGVTVYRTLGADAEVPRHATIRAVLDPALSLGDLQAMLAELRLHIVGGPSSAGVFSLAPEAGATSVTTAQTVSMLRSRAGVRFAEPTHGGTERP
jgi:predicted anti-sigma-YlaC factor YlaD